MNESAGGTPAFPGRAAPFTGTSARVVPGEDPRSAHASRPAALDEGGNRGRENGGPGALATLPPRPRRCRGIVAPHGSGLPHESALAGRIGRNRVPPVRARTSRARSPDGRPRRCRKASCGNRRAALRPPRSGAPRTGSGGRPRGPSRSPRPAGGALSAVAGGVVRTVPPRPSRGPPRSAAPSGSGPRFESDPPAPCLRLGRSGGLEPRPALVRGPRAPPRGDVARAPSGRAHRLRDPRPGDPGGASEELGSSGRSYAYH